MIHRHLDIPEGTPVESLGAAAIDDLLDRGDLTDWVPLARAIAAEPGGRLADLVIHLCDAHPMYGTSLLWKSWIVGLRTSPASDDDTPLSLSALRTSRGLTQTQVGRQLGISQSDVSKLERRRDVRVSTLSAVIQALGGTLKMSAQFPDAEAKEIDVTLGKRRRRRPPNPPPAEVPAFRPHDVRTLASPPGRVR